MGSLSPEKSMENFGVPTPWTQAEGHTHRVASARREGTPRGLRPRARTEAPRAGTGRSHVRLWKERSQAAPGSSRTHAGDERTWEVGRPRSTWEAAEQSRETGRGGGGGKGAGQGEPAQAQRAPDTEPGRRAKRARAGTSGRRESSRAARRRHPRWEPDAVIPHVRICAGGAGRPVSLPRQDWGALQSATN